MAHILEEEEDEKIYKFQALRYHGTKSTGATGPHISGANPLPSGSQNSTLNITNMISI
jgi:hypothetical protein